MGNSHRPRRWKSWCLENWEHLLPVTGICTFPTSWWDSSALIQGPSVGLVMSSLELGPPPFFSSSHYLITENKAFSNMQTDWKIRHTNFASAPKYSNTKSVTGKVPTSSFVHRLGLQEAKNEGQVVFYSFRQQKCFHLHETVALIIKKASLLSIYDINQILREWVLNKDNLSNHADLVGKSPFKPPVYLGIWNRSYTGIMSSIQPQEC